MRGRVLLELGGEEKELRLDNNALALFEELMGASVPKLLSENNYGFRFVQNALYAGLRYTDRKLTPQKIGKMMDGEEFSYLAEKVMEAVASAFGETEEGEEMESQEES